MSARGKFASTCATPLRTAGRMACGSAAIRNSKNAPSEVRGSYIIGRISRPTVKFRIAHHSDNFIARTARAFCARAGSCRYLEIGRVEVVPGKKGNPHRRGHPRWSRNTNRLLHGSAIEFRYGEFHNRHSQHQVRFSHATTPVNTPHHTKSSR
jgi:hypothetical protein